MVDSSYPGQYTVVYDIAMIMKSVEMSVQWFSFTTLFVVFSRVDSSGGY